MQETQNYKFKKIDKETDKILDSIDYLNENFDDIDLELDKINKNLGDFETLLENITTGSGV